MKVVVKLAGPLRAAAGEKEIGIEMESPATTGGVLHEAAERLPGLKQELFGAEPKGYFSVFVNDRLVPEKERDHTPVHDGDVVMFLLPIAGGVNFLTPR